MYAKSKPSINSKGPSLSWVTLTYEDDDAATFATSSSVFKICEATSVKKSAGDGGADGHWGTKDLDANCGKMAL